MKRAFAVLLLPLLLLSACAKVEEPAQTEPPQKAALAPEERLYAKNEAGYNLSGRNFTLEGLNTLSAALNAQPWDDLATFLLAFDLRTAADLRFCDFRPYGSVVSTQPQCLEEGAYISLRGDVFCALVFTLEDGLYAPKCLVLSPRGYFDAEPLRQAFVRGADGSLFFLYGCAYGGADYEVWNSCETGEMLFSFLVFGKRRVEPSQAGGIGYQVRETGELSHEGARTEDGFWLAARSELELYVFDGSLRSWEQASHTGLAARSYDVYYDAKLRRFYTAIDARTALYGELAQEEDEFVAQYAAKLAAWFIPAPYRFAVPGESDRFSLEELTPPRAPYGSGRIEKGAYLTRQKLDLLKLYVDARAGGGLREALCLGGAGELPENFPALLWSKVQTADCRLDFYTASEREVYMQIHLLSGEEPGGEGDSCVLLIFELAGTDTWVASSCLWWDASSAGYLGDGARVEYDRASRTRIISIEAGEQSVELALLNAGRMETTFSYLSYHPFDKTIVSYSAYGEQEDVTGLFRVYDLANEESAPLVFPVYLSEDGTPYIDKAYLAEFTRGQDDMP